MKLQHKVDYQRLRREQYPDVGEQLDAMVELAKCLQEQGVQLPPKVQAWIQACDDVKCSIKKV
uniref:Uncharacterized protein n=1 Tax=Pseudomonas phage vB_PaeS_HTN2 TaxID=3236647 RepID=A0AB39AI73_9VIRU